MRIVIDATAAVSGGKVYLDQLLKQFAVLADGYEFIIFHNGDFDKVLLPQSENSRFFFRRVSIPFQRTPFQRKSIGSSMLKMLWRKFVLSMHLMRLKPDLLFSNAGFGPVWKPLSVKTVLALHNSMPLREELIAEEQSILRRLRLIFLRRLMEKALGRCDRAIVFSEDTRKRLGASFGTLRRMPSVVYHGIDWGERERRPINKDGSNGLVLEPSYLLYVSQFHRYKNLLRLVEAFASLSRKHGQLSLVLVGEASDKRYWHEVEACAARLGIQHRIRHISGCPREELIAIYRNALAFVHPSLAETCSFPLLEAMAMGLPIAAAEESALPEMATDAAVYFNPLNVMEIAEVLDRLVYDETLRAQLSEKAIARAAAFSWEETARKTLAVFEQAISDS